MDSIRKKKLLSILGLIIGLAIIAYFPVTEAIDANRRNKVIESLEQTVYETDDSWKQEVLKQAEAWNDLITGEEPEIDRDDIWPYEKQLSLKGDNVSFGYVLIPKLSLSMPIYHGTEEAALSAGAGHLEYTSLPIGGEGQHSAITAHSGMKNMRAFDDIRDLKEGDIFGVSVLGEMRCYKVTDMETVEPTNLDSLTFMEGEDLCTLITCTPYGVNTHRLLVHGRRCPVPEHFGEEPVQIVETITNRRIWPLLVATIFVISVFVIAWKRIKKEHKTQN